MSEEQSIFLNRERKEERHRQRERERGRRTLERMARETTYFPTRGRRKRRQSLHRVSCSRASSAQRNQPSEHKQQQSETLDQIEDVLHHNEKMLGSLRERSLKERIQNAKSFIDANGLVLGHIQTIPSESCHCCPSSPTSTERKEGRQIQRRRERGRSNFERLARELMSQTSMGRPSSMHQTSCSRTAEELNQTSEQVPQHSETPDDHLEDVLHHNEQMLGSLRERSMIERLRNAKSFTDATGRVLGDILTIPSEFRLEA